MTDDKRKPGRPALPPSEKLVHLFAGLPQRHEAWDGHDTPEKYRRVDAAFRA